MANIRNSVTLIGHLGRDPETKVLDNGRHVAKISIATSETYTNQKGEKVTDTQWHTCVAWGKQAETMGTYLRKGKEVAIRGKLTHREYETKEGKRYVSEVIVDDFALVGSPKRQDQ